MADLEKSVAIIFEGVDQMGSGVDSATKRIDGVAEAVQQASRPLADFTKDVFAFEGALLAAGAAVTGFAIKLAGDFDSQFREISTLIDAPTESLAGFRQEILDYSGDSTQALDTINSALYNAISAGVDYTDSLDVVAQAERAAVAGKAELDQSLTVLVSSLNAYGAGMDEAEHFSDLLFQTVKNGVTTLPELGGSLSQVTGLAATAGVSFEELLAAVATLTATGSSTSSAITQIRGAISTLLKPTKEASRRRAGRRVQRRGAGEPRPLRRAGRRGPGYRRQHRADGPVVRPGGGAQRRDDPDGPGRRPFRRQHRGHGRRHRRHRGSLPAHGRHGGAG